MPFVFKIGKKCTIFNNNNVTFIKNESEIKKLIILTDITIKKSFKNFSFFKNIFILIYYILFIINYLS